LFVTLTGKLTSFVTPATVSLPAKLLLPTFKVFAVKVILGFLSASKALYALLSIILPLVLLRFFTGMLNLTLLMVLPFTFPLKVAAEAVIVQSCMGEVPSTLTLVDFPVMF